jgi:endonuclease-3
MDGKRRALAIQKRLLEFYGNPTWRNSLPPLDELVSTILSQNTNDTNRDVAFSALKHRFPTWEDVRDAPVGKVKAAIRTAGLANQKAPRIQAALRSITRSRGDLSLEFLRKLSADEAKEWLTQFKGVGPKTAAIVLQFSLGKPAFPVDTHIYRVTGRVGLRPKSMSVEKAHPYFEGLFSEGAYYAAHLNIIRLGREICLARKPNCPACPVTRYCDYYRDVYTSR